MSSPKPNVQACSENKKDGRLIILLGIGIGLCCLYWLQHACVFPSKTPNHMRLQWSGTGMVVTEARCSQEKDEEASMPIIPADLTPFFFDAVPINEADQRLLQSISGIGPRMAQEILRIRTEQGPFRSPDDLLRIPGIGAKRIEKFAEQFSYR